MSSVRLIKLPSLKHKRRHNSSNTSSSSNPAPLAASEELSDWSDQEEIMDNKRSTFKDDCIVSSAEHQQSEEFVNDDFSDSSSIATFVASECTTPQLIRKQESSDDVEQHKEVLSDTCSQEVSCDKSAGSIIIVVTEDTPGSMKETNSQIEEIANEDFGSVEETEGIYDSEYPHADENNLYFDLTAASDDEHDINQHVEEERINVQSLIEEHTELELSDVNVEEGVVEEGDVEEGVVEEEGDVEEGDVEDGVVEDGVVEDGVVEEGDVEEGVVEVHFRKSINKDDEYEYEENGEEEEKVQELGYVEEYGEQVMDENEENSDEQNEDDQMIEKDEEENNKFIHRGVDIPWLYAPKEPVPDASPLGSTNLPSQRSRITSNSETVQVDVEEAVERSVKPARMPISMPLRQSSPAATNGKSAEDDSSKKEELFSNIDASLHEEKAWTLTPRCVKRDAADRVQLKEQATLFPFRSHFDKESFKKTDKLPSPKKALKNLLLGGRKKRKREQAEAEFDRLVNSYNPNDNSIDKNSDEWKKFEELNDRLKSSIAQTTANVQKLRDRPLDLPDPTSSALPPLPPNPKQLQLAKDLAVKQIHSDWSNFAENEDEPNTLVLNNFENAFPEVLPEEDFKCKNTSNQGIRNDCMTSTNMATSESNRSTNAPVRPPPPTISITSKNCSENDVPVSSASVENDAEENVLQLQQEIEPDAQIESINFGNDDFFDQNTDEAPFDDLGDAAFGSHNLENDGQCGFGDNFDNFALAFAAENGTMDIGCTSATARPRPKPIQRQSTLSGNNPFRATDPPEEDMNNFQPFEKGLDEKNIEDLNYNGELGADGKPFNPFGTIYPESDESKTSDDDEPTFKIKIKSRTQILEAPLEQGPVPALSAPPKIVNPRNFEIEEDIRSTPPRPLHQDQPVGWDTVALCKDDEPSFAVDWTNMPTLAPVKYVDVAMEARSRLRSPSPEVPPFQPFYETIQHGTRLSLLLRQPEKKKKVGKQMSKFTTDRWWKEVWVELDWDHERPAIKLFETSDEEKPYRIVRLETFFALSRDKPQQYDKFGKVHIFKVNGINFKEIAGMRTEKFSMRTLQNFISKPTKTIKNIDLIDHHPIRTEVLKFGSMDQTYLRSFMRQIEDDMMKIKFQRDVNKSTEEYIKEEMSSYVQEEYHATIDKNLHIVHHLARVRIYFLAFVNGYPKVELGINDKWRFGKEVVRRQDIIPIIHDEWITFYEPEFHSVIDMDQYEKDHMIHFVPPDAAKFELMRFRVTLRDNLELPLQARCNYKINSNDVEIRCDVVVPGYFSSSVRCQEVPCEDIEIRVPIPEEWIYHFRQEGRFKYNSVHSTLRKPGRIKGFERITQMAQGFFPTSIMETNCGIAKYEQLHKAVVWRIKRLPEAHQGAYKNHILTIKLTLAPHDICPDYATLEPQMYVEFNMPGAPISGAAVRSIATNLDEPPSKYVKYVANFIYNVEIDYELGERKEIAIKSVLDDAPAIINSSDEDYIHTSDKEISDVDTERELVAVNGTFIQDSLINFDTITTEPPPPLEFTDSQAKNCINNGLSLLMQEQWDDVSSNSLPPPPIMFSGVSGDLRGEAHDLLADPQSIMPNLSAAVENVNSSSNFMHIQDIQLADDDD